MNTSMNIEQLSGSKTSTPKSSPENSPQKRAIANVVEDLNLSKTVEEEEVEEVAPAKKAKLTETLVEDSDDSDDFKESEKVVHKLPSPSSFDLVNKDPACVSKNSYQEHLDLLGLSKVPLLFTFLPCIITLFCPNCILFYVCPYRKFKGKLTCRYFNFDSTPGCNKCQKKLDICFYLSTQYSGTPRFTRSLKSVIDNFTGRSIAVKIQDQIEASFELLCALQAVKAVQYKDAEVICWSDSSVKASRGSCLELVSGGFSGNTSLPRIDENCLFKKMSKVSSRVAGKVCTDFAAAEFITKTPQVFLRTYEDLPTKVESQATQLKCQNTDVPEKLEGNCKNKVKVTALVKDAAARATELRAATTADPERPVDVQERKDTSASRVAARFEEMIRKTQCKCLAYLDHYRKARLDLSRLQAERDREILACFSLDKDALYENLPDL